MKYLMNQWDFIKLIKKKPKYNMRYQVGQIFGEYPNTTFDSHVTLVRAKNTVGKQYLFYSIKSKQEFLQNSGKGSTNQLELSKTTIGNLEVMLPDKLLAEKFEAIQQPIHDKITILISANIRLERQRGFLLPKLMSGEIEV